MPILGEQGTTLTLFIEVSGEECQNVFTYHPVVSGNYTYPESFATAWWDEADGFLPQCLSEDVTIKKVHASANHPVGVPPLPDYTLFINAPGTVTSPPFPPHDSVRVYKIPDTTAIEPASPSPIPDFKFGRFGLPGIPESFADGGELTTAAKALIQTFAQNIGEILVGANTYKMHYGRNTSVAQPDMTFVVPVGDFVCGQWMGTQNSRKVGR